MDRKSILLVDDEPLILKSLSRELTSDNLKFDVAVATNGEEALHKISNNNFNLIVTDLLLPDFDGFQVLKAAKRKDVHTMVIILTGHADLKGAIDALRLGADDFLQKPCGADELLFRLNNCIVKQDLQRKGHPRDKFLCVCSYCKKIRTGQEMGQGKDQWYRMETYFLKVQGILVSHGCCPDCFIEQMASIKDSIGGEDKRLNNNKK